MNKLMKALLFTLLLALIARPTLAQPTFAEAEALMRVGQYQELLEQFQTYPPDTLELQQLHGEVLIVTGQWQAAQNMFAALSSLSARYQYCWLEYQQGKTASAQQLCEQLLSDSQQQRQLSSADLTALGQAARILGLHDPQWFPAAVDYFTAALTQNPDAMTAQLELADLLLEKYNNREAQEVIQQALQRDPLNAEALLTLARSQHFDHSPEARQTVEKALEINPNLVPARAFLARLLLESEHYADAQSHIEAALATNPKSLAALSLQAAVYFLTDQSEAFNLAKQAVLALNPRYDTLYTTLAEIAARNRLYPAALQFAQEAVKLNEHSWQGYGLLGMNQLRLGHIEAGIDNLERAFAGDPYNVWIKNTLDLTDTFADYTLNRVGPFAIMLHKSESELLLPYISEVAQAAYDTFSQQYGYQVKAPIRLEFYPRSADFSVRTAGIAGIGLLGVSFGPVIGMDSPAARAVGSFNWGSTLWHEIAHTFHLAMSQQRVPRWFSEGLAVYEERTARLGWGADPDPGFLAAYREGRLPPVSNLNSAFVRPRYPEQIQHAYYLASLVFDFIAARGQISKVPEMLYAFAKGQSMDEALVAVLGISAQDFDRAFDDYLRNRFATPMQAISELGRIMEQPGTLGDLILRAEWQPDRYQLQIQAGRQLQQADKLDRAEPYLLRAQNLFPQYAGDDSAYWLLARLYIAQERYSDAIEQLQTMLDINGEHLPAHLELARLLRQQGDFFAASEILERTIFITPYHIGIHQQLAELYDLLGLWTASLNARQAVLALDPSDLSAARYELARAYALAGQLPQARKAVLDALESAPHYAQAQDLLLELRALLHAPAD